METILVVDDERVIREGCRRIFTPLGYRVLMAANGREALDLLEAGEEPDVILCDLMMPVMGAIELMKETSRCYPELPLVVITGHGTVDNAVECMKQGAYDFVTKPFQVDHLVLIAKRALEKRALERRTKELHQARAKSLYDLATEQSRLGAVVNCMADGVMVTNLEREVVLHNPALAQLLELKSPVPHPGRLGDYFGDEAAAETLERLVGLNFVEKGFTSWEVSKDSVHLRAISAPVAGPGGEALGAVTVFQDVTGFKRLDEMKSNFVHMVSHELRAPMAAIKQQIQVILDGLAGEVSEKQRELLGRSQEKIQGLIDLVSELLDMARIESGHGVQRQVLMQLAEVIESTVELMRARAEQGSITLRLDFPPDVPFVYADPRRMDEVFTNLISNAINYSPEGGTVTIAAVPCGDYLEVLVSDTGVGIDAEEIPKIFDKFYRVKHPRTRKVIGTGLGLAIVKGIIDSHRGSIRVESEPGVGSTFRICLPTIGPDAQPSGNRPS